MTKRLKAIKLIVDNCMQCPYSCIQYGDEYGEPIHTRVKCQMTDNILFDTIAAETPVSLPIPEECPLDDVEIP